MPIRRIPFGEWLPDLGEFNNDGLYKVRSAINHGRRWLPAPILIGEEITGNGGANYTLSQVYGTHIHVSDTSITPARSFFVGTSDDLLRATSSLATVRATAVGIANAPDTNSGWQFTSFGNAIYAASFNTATGNGNFLRAATPTTNFATFVAATTPTTYSPIPRFVSVIKNHLLIAAVESQTTLGEFVANTYYPNLVMWSATDDPTRWGDELTANYPETVGSSYQHLYDEFGPITGLCGGMDYAYVFKQRAIYRMDGPEWSFHPVVTGAGTMYPNSIVRFYNDVYFWGPCGPARLTYGSSEIENLAFGKCQRAVTDLQNYDFFDYVFEIDNYSAYPIQANSGIRPIYISAAADYKSGLVAFFCHDRGIIPLGTDYVRSSMCLIYDTKTESFSAVRIPGKFGFARSAAVFGENPISVVSPSAAAAIQNPVLDGIIGVANARSLTAELDAQLAEFVGDCDPVQAITVSGADDSLYDWFPKFTTAYNPLLVDDDNGPITTRVKRVRVPFTIKRFDETVVNGYASGDYQWTVKVNVTVRSKNRYVGEYEEATGSWTSSDTRQFSDGWIDLNSGKGTTEAEYHQFEIEIVTLNDDGTEVNGLIVHLRDLTYFEVEYDVGNPCGSTYLA